MSENFEYYVVARDTQEGDVFAAFSWIILPGDPDLLGFELTSKESEAEMFYDQSFALQVADQLVKNGFANVEVVGIPWSSSANSMFTPVTF